MLTNIARCAVLSVPLTPYDTAANLSALTVAADKALPARPDIIVFGELSMAGASCGSLLRQKKLLGECLANLLKFAELYKQTDAVFILGLPLAVGTKVISAAAVVSDGKVHAFCASHGEQPALDRLTNDASVLLAGKAYPVLVNPLFRTHNILFTVQPGISPSAPLQPVGAQIVAAPTSALADPMRDYTVGARYASLSSMLGAGLLVCACGMGESSYRGVYKDLGGIFENGAALAFQYDFEPIGLIRDIDLDLLPGGAADRPIIELGGENRTRQRLNRHLSRNPFLPDGNRERVLDDIADTQIQGLATRIKPNHLKKLVVGVSGGIDSALALLVCAGVCDRLGMPRSDIIAVSMPGYGTKENSKGLSEALAQAVEATLRVISINDSVAVHFSDIGHDPLNHSATFENAQARERTQVLFDIAGSCDGLVVGTGDLSETALGWCTFGGDHLSGYNVNASLTKTMVTETALALSRRLGGAVTEIISRIASTPPSPELLPGEQITQDIIGPYELHDFFLYYFVRHNMAPDKIISLAEQAFEGEYTDKKVQATFEIFRRRFLTSQFKRGCASEGVVFGEISLSPYFYDFPSDMPTANF